MWVLDSFVVNSGNRMTSTACVTLRKGKKKHQEVATGAGPVNASLRAIEKIIRHPFILEEYQLQAVTEGREALGRVKIVAMAPEGTFTGVGTSTDIVEASARAYMDVVNKISRMRKYSPKLRGKRARALL